MTENFSDLISQADAHLELQREGKRKTADLPRDFSEAKNQFATDFFPCLANSCSENSGMRVLIQSTISFLYLKDRDLATQNPDEARDFKHAARAMRYVRQNRLNDVQIVLKFTRPADDVNLAILELLDREHRKMTAQFSKSSSAA